MVHLCCYRLLHHTTVTAERHHLDSRLAHGFKLRVVVSGSRLTTPTTLQATIAQAGVQSRAIHVRLVAHTICGVTKTAEVCCACGGWVV